MDLFVGFLKHLNARPSNIWSCPVNFPLRREIDSESEMSFGAGLAEGDLGVSENGGYLQFMDDHDIYIYIRMYREYKHYIIYINPYWRGRWRKRERVI